MLETLFTIAIASITTLIASLTKLSATLTKPYTQIGDCPINCVNDKKYIHIKHSLIMKKQTGNKAEQTDLLSQIPEDLFKGFKTMGDLSKFIG